MNMFNCHEMICITKLYPQNAFNLNIIHFNLKIVSLVPHKTLTKPPCQQKLFFFLFRFFFRNILLFVENVLLPISNDVFNLHVHHYFKRMRVTYFQLKHSLEMSCLQNMNTSCLKVTPNSMST